MSILTWLWDLVQNGKIRILSDPKKTGSDPVRDYPEIIQCAKNFTNRIGSGGSYRIVSGFSVGSVSNYFLDADFLYTPISS
ncbi:hypothetical protein HanIR_Chr08g0355731 [Helianthus annuus]|nr:hypothetical protein HanIR_Chr08g0355731 [Helianthus annuus]